MHQPAGLFRSVVRNKEKDGAGLTGDAPYGMSDEHFFQKSATAAFNIKKNELITTLGLSPQVHLRQKHNLIILDEKNCTTQVFLEKYYKELILREDMRKKEIIVLFVITLSILSFFTTYSLHFDYKFPYHHDEWQHLAISLQAIESGYNRQFNPYLGVGKPHADLEPGFHLFLSELFSLTGFIPVTSYKYLAAFFAVITSITIFFVIYRLTGDIKIAAISSVLFTFLPTNVNILGKNYFVPMTMSFPLIFIYVLFFTEAMRHSDIKKFYFSILILATLFFIYPLSFIVLLLPTLFEVFRNWKTISNIGMKNKFAVRIFLIPSLVFAFLMIWKGKLKHTIPYLKGLIFFEPGWGRLEISYFIPLLYGLSNTFLAVYGFIQVYLNNKYKNLYFFSIVSIISLFITALFNMLGFTFLIPYSRAIHYAMLFMIPLTAIGLVHLVIKVKEKIGIYGVVFVIIIFIAFNIYPIYPLNEKYQRYLPAPPIAQSDYNALLFVKDSFGKGNIIITPYFMTSAVYPASGNKVISLIPAQMEGGNVEDNLNFYSYDCMKKEEIIKKSGAKFVLSRLDISCIFLKEIYNRESTLVYMYD